MSSTKTIDAFMALQVEALEIFKRKNADYGDNFRKHGAFSVMVRMGDKIDRFINLVEQGGKAACKAEALLDTLIDLSNYALMAIIAHDSGESWGEDRKTLAITLDPVLNSQDIYLISEFISNSTVFRRMVNAEKEKDKKSKEPKP